MGKEIIRGMVSTDIIADMTVREIERIVYRLDKAGGSAKAGIDQKVAIAALFEWKRIKNFRYSKDGENLTIKELVEIGRDTRERFTNQHTINYMAHHVLMDFYDWLCDKKYITKTAEGYWRKAERTFTDYQNGQKTYYQRAIWMIFLDHMRLTYDALLPSIDALETAIRDYLIQHRNDITESNQKDDITLLQKAATCFMMLTCMQKSFYKFFFDIAKDHGVDFSFDFRYAYLDKMMRNTKWMCESIGIRFGIDKDGDTVLAGVNIENSVRIRGAWKKIIDILTDDDILNKMANMAIDMTPDEEKENVNAFFAEALKPLEEKRQKEMEELEKKKQQEMEEGFRLLQEKYNTKR